MSLLKKLARTSSVAFLLLFIMGLSTILGIYIFLAPGLPTASKIKEVHLQVPLRIYSLDGDLLAEYGEKRRKPLSIKDIPLTMRQAFLAAEDNRFFHHPGVDYQGLLRAAVHLVKTGQKGQGGSTITMQLTRNFFLSRERTYTRKLREIFLALKVERELSKEEILELYLNKIYLGNRAYGVGAAAQVYYGKQINELSLAQIAMIAGLPKAPSKYNPIADSDRAKIRRNYVLNRMHTLGFIRKKIYDVAISTPVSAQPHSPVVELQAPYVGEMVRATMVSRFGDEAYTKGLSVQTTISSSLQQAANEALSSGLIAYDKRHGYRGPINHFDLPPDGEIPPLDKLFAPYRTRGYLRIGLVGKVTGKQAEVYLDDGQKMTLEWEGMAWARAYINDNQIGPKPNTAEEILRPGDLIHVSQTAQNTWLLEQTPQVSGALISLSPQNGSILALVGGFDFYQSRFNRATQARRQPGSNFKPFVYSAALEKGYTPASIINDAPVVFSDAALENTWRPENYSGKFYGPTRLRTALSKSRNLVSIRLLHSIGTQYAIDYISRFGFDREKLPDNLSLALGSGAITPLQLISGYTIFANGGFKVTPYLISSIKTTEGQVLFEASPNIACEEPCQTADSDVKAIENTNINLAEHSDSSPRYAPRIISAPIAYQIVSMMKDVIRTGTARKARKLGRSDLAGKTGTTNDQRDAWFSGFNADVATTVWVGFDQYKPLGNRETGGKAALPVWIDYMKIALKNKPEHSLKQPEGMLTMRIDPQTGLLAGTDNPNGIFETFRAEFAPARSYFEVSQTTETAPAPSASIPEQLF